MTGYAMLQNLAHARAAYDAIFPGVLLVSSVGIDVELMVSTKVAKNTTAGAPMAEIKRRT